MDRRDVFLGGAGATVALASGPTQAEMQGAAAQGVVLVGVDEAAVLFDTPVGLSAQKFGTRPRHSIVVEDDKTIPAAARDFMTTHMDAAGLGLATIVHRLPGIHSPFFAQPEALADPTIGIATA